MALAFGCATTPTPPPLDAIRRQRGTTGNINAGRQNTGAERTVCARTTGEAHMRNVSATAAMIVAVAVAEPRAIAAEPLAGTKETRAEVQIGLCAPADRIKHALDLRPRGGPLNVWLFDDLALTLFGRGLRLRLRAATGRSDFTLKVANQDCARLNSKAVPPGEGRCKYDVYGTGMTGAVSLTRRLNADSTNDLLAGRVAPAQMLSPSQIAYLRDVVAMWPLPSGIRGLGPMQVWSYRAKRGLYDIDVSRLPTGEEYVEISRKVPVAEATRAMDVMKADLSRAGIEMCADQSAQVVNKLRSLLR